MNGGLRYSAMSLKLFAPGGWLQGIPHTCLRAPVRPKLSPVSCSAAALFRANFRRFLHDQWPDYLGAVFVGAVDLGLRLLPTPPVDFPAVGKSAPSVQAGKVSASSVQVGKIRGRSQVGDIPAAFCTVSHTDFPQRHAVKLLPRLDINHAFPFAFSAE